MAELRGAVCPACEYKRPARGRAGRHLSWLLLILDSYREIFHYALLLEKYSTIELNRRPHKSHDDVYLGWHGIAMREAALALFHFNYILTGIGHSINPHSPDGALIFRNARADSDIGISTLSWIKRGGDGGPGG